MGIGNNQINTLVPSSVILDDDLGLIKLIQNKYRDPTYFSLEKLDLPEDKIIQMLVDRKYINPLNCFLNNPEHDAELYTSFIDEMYEEILKLSTITGIGDFVSHMCKVPGINIQILVSDVQEERLLEYEGFKNSQFIYYSDMTKEAFNAFDAVFVKNVCNLPEKTEGKVLYIARYGFNIVNKNNINDSFYNKRYTELTSVNEIKTLAVYSYSEEETENE